MVDMDTLASERLELLSNTAMLKKVMERRDPVGGSRGPRGEVPAFSRYEKPEIPIAPAQAPPASPKSLVSDHSQRRETPSPHAVVEASRDSPPSSYRMDSSNKRVCQPHDEYHFHRNSYRQPKGSHYPPFPPPHAHYMDGSCPERYFPHHRAPGAVAPHAQGRMHSAHTVNNIGPPPFPSPYDDRRPIAVRGNSHHGTAPPARGVPFYSPTASVSEDGDDANAVVEVPNRQSYEALVRENYHMRDQLQDKDSVIASLQQRVNQLEIQISELKQLPTGKISHIPVDDMIRIMQEYGSEISNQTLPKRRENIKKASIVRQFRRWNPEFFRYFIHVNGEWVPKLGKEGELQRRAEKRQEIKLQSAIKHT